MKVSLNYQEFFLRLKSQIQAARIKLIISANSQLLELYWEIGNAILKQQNMEVGALKYFKGYPWTSKMHFLTSKGSLNGT